MQAPSGPHVTGEQTQRLGGPLDPLQRPARNNEIEPRWGVASEREGVRREWTFDVVLQEEKPVRAARALPGKLEHGRRDIDGDHRGAWKRLQDLPGEVSCAATDLENPRNVQWNGIQYFEDPIGELPLDPRILVVVLRLPVEVVADVLL